METVPANPPGQDGHDGTWGKHGAERDEDAGETMTNRNGVRTVGIKAAERQNVYSSRRVIY